MTVTFKGENFTLPASLLGPQSSAIGESCVSRVSHWINLGYSEYVWVTYVG